MNTRYPLATKLSAILHGGDYNPEQWLDRPEVLKEDLRLMKLAGVNVVTLGVFSWSMLEPQRGQYQFGWLDGVINELYRHGIYVVLATPSGAKPNWLGAGYDEVRRVNAGGQREMQSWRHNHCMTSPVYRERVEKIDEQLAIRYGKHEGLILWHVSNEYGGYCYCPLCKQAFRGWLQRKYGSLEALNRAWWTRFWSHTYTDWGQIDYVDESVHGLVLDWKRFMTDQTVDFMKHEIGVLRRHSPGVGVTTNMMGTYEALNYQKFAGHLDVVSWDAYPNWHVEKDSWKEGIWPGFVHDLNRGLKGGKPFILMESSPSQTNWQDVSPLKRPGMHKLSSLQAVAHGADSVMYFQWRKSRGSFEKFHGAVVDHVGHERTRVFGEVAELGAMLGKMSKVAGSGKRAKVGLIYDWENRWAIEAEKGPRNVGKDYERTCVEDFYRPLWERNVGVDVIGMEQGFEGYELLIAPMLYMVRPGVGERIQKFVEAGGTFVGSYFSGMVDENDLCFLNGFPGPMREVMGVWAEEMDVVTDDVRQVVEAEEGNELGLKGKYEARQFCELIHCDSPGTVVVARYGSDFYAGRVAVTRHEVGKGQAYYIASRNDRRFQDDFFAGLIEKLKLSGAVKGKTPGGVSAQVRMDGENEYLFLMNFTKEEKEVELEEKGYVDMGTREAVRGKVRLEGYGSMVLERRVG